MELTEQRYNELCTRAIAEAKNLKKFAKRKEINRLNYLKFKPTTIHGCIYGQMTTNCFSKRSKILINKCCEKVYVTPGNIKKAQLNGKPSLKMERDCGVGHFSPIEVLILQGTISNQLENGRRIIEYLKSGYRFLGFTFGGKPLELLPFSKIITE
jgi:hypothetical protein